MVRHKTFAQNLATICFVAILRSSADQLIGHREEAICSAILWVVFSQPHNVSDPEKSHLAMVSLQRTPRKLLRHFQIGHCKSPPAGNDFAGVMKSSFRKTTVVTWRLLGCNPEACWIAKSFCGY